MKKTILLIGLVILLSACSTPQDLSRSEQVVEGALTVFKSPTCGCCTSWGEHMQDSGYEVVYVDDMGLESLKQELDIPNSVWSCHTTIVDEYFIEGHVSEEIVAQLLSERPDIDGIAMAGMPVGSAGMPGLKSQDFVVHAIEDGRVLYEFARI